MLPTPSLHLFQQIKCAWDTSLALGQPTATLQLPWPPRWGGARHAACGNHPQPTLNLDLPKTVQVGPGQNGGKDCAQQDGLLQVLQAVAWHWFNITNIDSKPQEPGLNPEFSSHFLSEVLVGCDLAALSISQTSTELYYSWHGCFCVLVPFLEQTLLL